MKRRAPLLALLAINAVIVVACEDEVVTAPPPPARRAIAPVTSATASASASVAAPGLTEAEFTRADSNRDPFFPYPPTITAKPPNERAQALADNYSLDELKLVGIITGNTAPRAMFIDPTNKGWIVTLGQLVGRSEVVKAGGGGLGAEYDLHWKVDRIRDQDVVFVRETPGRPNVPSATRVIPLRAENEPVVRRR